MTTEYTATLCGKVVGKRGTPLKPQHDKDGYARFSLRENGITKNKSVHKFVWEFFKGPIPEGLEVDHKDGNRGNNKISNLQLLTHAQNVRKGRRLLTDEEVKAIKLFIGKLPQREIGNAFNVSRELVSRIANKTLWSDVT